MSGVLDLSAFAKGARHLSPACCASLAESAVVCLEHRGHPSGVALACVDADTTLAWTTPDDRATASRADLQEATEDGATAIAILWVQQRSGLEVVRRARKGTGFDWYLGPVGAGPPFAGLSCLEVSGILEEDHASLTRRLNTKVAQVGRGGRGMPGFAVVVGFSGPSAVLETLP